MVGTHLQRPPDGLTITTVLVISNDLFSGQTQLGTGCPCSSLWIRALDDCTIKVIVRTSICLIDDLEHLALTRVEISVHRYK